MELAEEQILHLQPADLDGIFLAETFDALYARAEQLNRQFSASLCDVREGQCANGRRCGKTSFCCQGHYGQASAQVDTCIHLGRQGCMVQSLRCKLWFCGAIEQGQKTLRVTTGVEKSFSTAAMQEFIDLVKTADHFGFLVHRGTREQSIRQAVRKWGCLTE